MRLRRHDFEHVALRAFHGAERNFLVERDEAASPLDGQTQQIHVRQLAVTAREREIKQSFVTQRNGVLPEFVMSARAERPEVIHQVGYRDKLTAARQVAKHPHEAILRQWTTGPTRCAVVLEPVVRELMVNVVGIEQRHENIYVEQRHAAHGSSSSSSTIRVVTMRPG